MNSFIDIGKAVEVMGLSQGESPFLGNWSDRNPMNTPGPLYCAVGDNCGTGPLIGPNNIVVDENGYDVVFRQPTSEYELRQVLQAAAAEPFQSYCVDGDRCWSYSLIREWWKQKGDVEAKIYRMYMRQLSLGDRKDYYEFSMLSRWLSYYKEYLYEYLRTYAFFTEEGRIPSRDDLLPML